MPRLLLGIAYVALVVYALVDVVQSDDEDRHGLPKVVWIGAIIFLPLIGSIAWIILSFLARRRKGQGAAAQWGRTGGATASPKPPADKAPTGPEDDPEYMWLLERSRLKKEREERESSKDGDDDAEAPGDEPHSDGHSENGNRS